MAGDVQLTALAIESAPLTYTVPLSAEVLLKSVRAEFDGSGAAGSWLPAVQIVSDSAHIVATASDQGAVVSAGGSADGSFFPGVKPQTQAASTGLTQIWWFGALWQENGSPQAIGNDAWTQLTFSGQLGPGFGAGTLVEFDDATSTVRFNYDSGLGNLRHVRLSGYWAASSGLKRLQLRFSISGTANVTLPDNLAAANYLPTNDLTTDETFQELVTLVTPFNFLVPGSYIAMTAWAYQATGASRNFNDAALEVYGPSTANGQA